MHLNTNFQKAKQCNFFWGCI